MRKFNFFCSLVLVLTTTIMIITAGQNLVMRTSAGYTYYFNDTGVVSKISDKYTNSQMSKEITAFMNSWRPDEFQVYEDTGYDLEGIFGKHDSDNMLAVKKMADISIVLFAVSTIITAAIYIYFIRNDFKLVLRKRVAATGILTLIICIVEVILLKTDWGITFLMNVAGIETLPSYSALKSLLGGDFAAMAGIFLLLYTAVILIGVIYLTMTLTKKPRIFY